MTFPAPLRAPLPPRPRPPLRGLRDLLLPAFFLLLGTNSGASLPCLPSGPPLGGLLAGDLAPAPAGPFTEIACVEIRNDRPFERAGEVAFSSIPVANGLLTQTTGLALVGPGERLLAGQFQVVSRWGGTVDDPTRPIRWLGVSVQPRVPPNGSVAYSLRRYATPPTPADPFAATILPDGAAWVVDTGLASFRLSPSNPAVIDSIASDLDGAPGRETIYTHAAGAGPRLEIGGTVLGTPGAVVVDPVAGNPDFRILENGPVKVVVATRGHFLHPGGASLCAATTPAYESWGYTAVLTFERGSRDVSLDFHFRNECSDALNPPWDDESIVVDRISWELPLVAIPDNAFSAGLGAGVQTSPNGFAGLTLVEQRKGAGSPWLRRARVQRDAATLASGEALDRPIVAVAGGNLVAAAQMPWMPYREPQALAVTGGTLSLRVVSETQRIGEAKGLWNAARILLTSTTLANQAGGIAAWVDSRREPGLARLERGLLPRLPLDELNATRILPSLGTTAPSSLKTEYVQMMNQLHDETVLPGGQWSIARAFGSQLWPESASRDPWNIANDTPADHPAEHNYWNPTTAEFLEFLRTGDPKWVWDFAMPQSWLQGYTAYVNLGERSHGNRNGFVAMSGSTGVDGQWHRPNCAGQGSCGSADYSYNTGMHLAHALAPAGAMVDRFGQGGLSVIDRYNVPHANQGAREQWVNDVSFDRFQGQHLEGLANCAEFVAGPRGQQCHDKLIELFTELVADNFAAGIFCSPDIPDPALCWQPQQFMKNAMFYALVQRIHRNYGDLGGGLRRVLVGEPQNLYQWGIARNGSAIDPAGDWAPVLRCTLASGGTVVTGCTMELVDESPMFNPNKPHTLALLLMSDELDPSNGLCPIVRNAFTAMSPLSSFWGEYAIGGTGWIKGTSQMMQGMAFAVGLCDVCGGDTDGDGFLDASDCAPANPSAWGAPGPARSVNMLGSSIGWTAPAQPGGSLLTYDLVRSSSASDFSGGFCVASNSTATAASDAAAPPPGGTFFYVVRSRNACGANAGADSAGVPRTIPGC